MKQSHCTNCGRELEASKSFWVPLVSAAPGPRCEPCYLAALHPGRVLRGGVIVMVRRALSTYAREYLTIKEQSKEQWEKDEAQKRIDAIDSLNNQLLRGN